MCLQGLQRDKSTIPWFVDGIQMPPSESLIAFVEKVSYVSETQKRTIF
jgi:hypothetical protein